MGGEGVYKKQKKKKRKKEKKEKKEKHRALQHTSFHDV